MFAQNVREVWTVPQDRINLVVRQYSGTPGGPDIAFAQELHCTSVLMGLIVSGDEAFILDYMDAGESLIHPEEEWGSCFGGWNYIGLDHAPTDKRIDWP